MSERAINDPTVAGWELDPDTGYWMWGASGGSGGSYDDTEVRGLISDNSDRITALEDGGGGGGGDLWTDNGDGTISYSGVAKASDFIAE